MWIYCRANLTAIDHGLHQVSLSAGERGNAVKRTAMATTLLLGMLFAAQAGAAPLTGHGPRDTPRHVRAIPGHGPCIVDVLHSEELTGAPPFYHLITATLLVTPPHSPACETTVQELISWQAPPPRRGQRFRRWCDPANPGPFTFR